MFVLRGSHNIPPETLSGLREDFREYFGIMLIIVLLVSAIIGWVMAKRAFSRVEGISRTATAISEGVFESRVPTSGRKDEIDLLAGNFNIMIERIEGLIRGMKETNDNIAHDLRSAVARIRSAAEVTLTTSSILTEYQAMAGTILEECDRLLVMINTMLDISEAEAGITILRLEDINIEAMVQDMLDLFGPVIEGKNLQVNLRSSGFLSSLADKQKIQRTLSNIFDNATKYTPQDGSIAVSLNGTDYAVHIAVQDTGIGIPEAESAHIFDRFYRGEKSRSTPGSGLGLSLARAFVVAHSGSITVTSTPGEGSEFIITLPKPQR
jgi:signal transduction histidine kinase